jgi:hypothetical protein
MRDDYKPDIKSLSRELILYRQRAIHAQSEVNVAIYVARRLLSELSGLLRRADSFDLGATTRAGPARDEKLSNSQ